MAKHSGIPRCIEVALAAGALLVLLPVFAVVAVAIKLTSPGPVFFRQERIGLGGRPFWVLKFRKMRDGASGLLLTSANDRRVTAMGRFLKKTKLDELPQLWNLLRGDISLVGPRPEVPEYYDADNPLWREVVQVRPGITDPVTLELRNEDELFEELGERADEFYRTVLLPYKLLRTMDFLRNRSWRSDLNVVLQTLTAVMEPSYAPPPTSSDIRRRLELLRRRPVVLRPQASDTGLAGSSTGCFRHFGLKRLGAMGIDALIVVTAYSMALSFRFQEHIPPEYGFVSSAYLVFTSVAIVVHLACNCFFRVYRIVNRYVGVKQVNWIIGSSAVAATLLLAVCLVAPGPRLMPLWVVVMGGGVSAVVMVGVRFYSRLLQTRSLNSVIGMRRMLIVGAGQAAELLVREISQNRKVSIKLVGLVDDNPDLHGMRIHSHPVLGSVADVPRLVPELDVTEVVIAIPSISADQMATIYEKIRPAGVPIKTLPPVTGFIEADAQLASARDLDIVDLIGRPQLDIDTAAIESLVSGRRVLITGAAGSVGSELARQLVNLGAGRLILVDRDESSLCHLDQELSLAGYSRHVPVPASVLEQTKVQRLLRDHRPHVVFHCAASKHVPLYELAPDEAVINNVEATRILARQASLAGVEDFVHISTDKAADPAAVIGATKLASEHVLQHVATDSPTTRFCSIRYGNGLGSNGSVVQMMRQQIQGGGPVTVTHPDATRSFVWIREAVMLTLQAAALHRTRVAPVDSTGDCVSSHAKPQAAGYCTYVLDLGQPVRIMDLAQRMVDFYGNHGLPSVEIKTIGLRPGEKLHEVLTAESETAVPTSHPMIRRVVAVGAGALPRAFAHNLARLIGLAQRHADSPRLVAALRALLPTYRPAGELLEESVASLPEGPLSVAAATRIPEVASLVAPREPAPTTSPQGAPTHGDAESPWHMLVSARMALEMETAPQAIVIADAHHRVVYVNPAYERLLGYRRDQVLGRDTSTFLGSRGAHKRTALRMMAMGRGSFTTRLQVTAADGGQRELDVTLSALLDVDGTMLGNVAVATAANCETAIESCAATPPAATPSMVPATPYNASDG